MGAFVIELVLVVIDDIILPPLLMLLALPFIPIVALFGKGSYKRKLNIHTVRLWRWLKAGTFLSALDTLFDRERIPLPEKPAGRIQKSPI